MACRLSGAKPLSKPMNWWLLADHTPRNSLLCKIYTYQFSLTEFHSKSVILMPFCPGGHLKIKLWLAKLPSPGFVDLGYLQPQSGLLDHFSIKMSSHQVRNPIVGMRRPRSSYLQNRIPHASKMASWYSFYKLKCFVLKLPLISLGYGCPMTSDQIQVWLIT